MKCLDDNGHRCSDDNNLHGPLSVTCGRFSQVSSTNKTDNQDITEILLKEALNTIQIN
jgi:hypothetical protein